MPTAYKAELQAQKSANVIQIMTTVTFPVLSGLILRKPSGLIIIKRDGLAEFTQSIISSLVLDEPDPRFYPPINMGTYRYELIQIRDRLVPFLDYTQDEIDYLWRIV